MEAARSVCQVHEKSRNRAAFVTHAAPVEPASRPRWLCEATLSINYLNNSNEEEDEQVLLWLIFSCDYSPCWRREGDLNPRKAKTSNGFQDRRNQPLCHPSVVEPVGIEPTFTPCKGGVLPLNYGPVNPAVRADDRRVARRGKYRMTRRENHGRSGGDRNRGHLLPKQVRCLCATLRAGRQPDADGHGHDGSLFVWLPHKPSRPQSRQRQVVISKMENTASYGHCRSGEGKKRPKVAPGPGLLIGKGIQQPFIRRDFMKNETIELIDEKIDHLYAMQMAGYSTICGLLFAQLKQNSFGRALSRDELEECLLWGREALADSYLESLQSRQASSQNRRPKNV